MLMRHPLHLGSLSLYKHTTSELLMQYTCVKVEGDDKTAAFCENLQPTHLILSTLCSSGPSH